MNKFSYLLKNTGILAIANFASKLLIFFLVPLYTSVLSTEEYGVFDLAISTVTLLYPILSLDIHDAVMRFTMEKNFSKNQIAIIGLKLVTASILIFGAGMFFISRFGIWKQVSGLEIYIFLYYATYTLNQFLLQFSKGLEKVKDIGTAGVISTVIMILANLVFLLHFRWGISGFFCANILANITSLVYLLCAIKIWKYITGFRHDNNVLKCMLKYCTPLIATMTGWWINSTADKYVVTFFWGVSANGILAVAYKIPQIINTIQGIFIQAWHISAIREYGTDESRYFFGKVFKYTNLLVSASCSWLILLTKVLAKVLFSDDFYQAWSYVPFLLLSSVINCASGILGSILAAKKKSKVMMWSAIAGSIVNIFLNICLVSWIGIQGATIATVICSFIIFFVRQINIKSDILISDKWRIWCTWIGLFAQCILAIYSMEWIELIIMVMLLVINMPEILSICKEFRVNRKL